MIEFNRINTLIFSRLFLINKAPTPLNQKTCKPLFRLKKKIKCKGLTLEQKEENMAFKNKLKRQTSIFNLDKWKDDYKMAQKYKKNICSFPSIDFRKTFQNYFDINIIMQMLIDNTRLLKFCTQK